MKNIAIVLCISLLLGACSLNKQKKAVTNAAYRAEGGYATVVPVAVKDFEIKGVIFVSSKVTYDVAGDKTGSEITHEMLMREAVKLGADDVANVRIDRRDVNNARDNYEYNALTNAEEFTDRERYPQETIYTATALAIKYTTPAPHHAMPAPVMMEEGIKSFEVAPAAAAPAVKAPVEKSKKKVSSRKK